MAEFRPRQGEARRRAGLHSPALGTGNSLRIGTILHPLTRHASSAPAWHLAGWVRAQTRTRIWHLGCAMGANEPAPATFRTRSGSPTAVLAPGKRGGIALLQHQVAVRAVVLGTGGRGAGRGMEAVRPPGAGEGLVLAGQQVSLPFLPVNDAPPAISPRGGERAGRRSWEG